MLGSIFAWMASGTGLTVLGGMLSVLGITGGAVAVRRYRKKRTQKMKKDVVGAVRAHKVAAASTPRGKLRAKRKAEPKRLTVGHRRTEDDPTRTRVAARKAKAAGSGWWERVRVARANRKATKKTKPLELVAGSNSAERSDGRCGYKGTTTGRPCRLPKVIGSERCQVHGGKRAA